VSTSGLFGIGGNQWTSAFQVNGTSASRNSRIALNVPEVTVDEAREQLRAASRALADAFRTFTNEKRPVYTTSVSATPSVAAALSGVSAHLSTTYGSPSVLQTTLKVNTQTSTIRSSSSGIGLDTTSAETASTLKSSATLGLDLNSVASTITSTAEMNTDTTSYGSSTLNFTGTGLASTSVGTLTGTYTGVNTAAGATSLVVKITGTASPNALLATNVKFEVRDQANNLLFSHDGNIKAGDQVYLGADIGLSVSFSAGQLTQNHTASTTVSHAPVDVDANATFNDANTSLRPKFDNSAQVTAGSFTISGTSITVNANDTINTVITRINASAAGVTAALAGDKITLTTNSSSESNIVLASDTSGFLSATKLASATTTRGNIRDDQQALSGTTQFGSVTNGSFTVNGVSISVNKDTDTLSSIISRINSSSAGVTASCDSTQDKVILTTNSNSEDLITVAGDTTGFLTAGNLSSSNTVRGNIRDDQQVFSKTTQFAAVTSGSFNVNGTSISVDASQDTLQTMIGKINSAGVGVTASYNSNTDKVVFTPDVAGAALALESDTSGFFTAAKVTTGTVGTHVNANAAFNGTGLNSPLFDPGVAVQAGSFTVNGVAITVAANDTINTVLTRITASQAGVTATYDDTTQTLKLTAKQDAATPITVGGDTSGFLAAVKFDGTATSTTGAKSIYPFDSVLSDMSEYSGVQGGVVTVNGQQIAIDPATTTVRGLVSALNGITDVSATLNETFGTVTISSKKSGTALSLSDTSGVLSALKITAGTYKDTPGTVQMIETQTGTTVSNSSAVAENVSKAVEKLNEALSQLGKVREDGSLRLELQATLRKAIDSLGDAGAKGLILSESGPGMSLSVDRDKLAGALTKLLGAETDLDTAISGLLDKFNGQTAALAAPPEPELPAFVRSLTQIGDLRAQLMANEISNTLRLLKSSSRLLTPDVSTLRKAAEKYGENSGGPSR
jgi:flagellar hook-associated protein 2